MSTTYQVVPDGEDYSWYDAQEFDSYFPDSAAIQWLEENDAHYDHEFLRIGGILKVRNKDKPEKVWRLRIYGESVPTYFTNLIGENE